MSPLYYRPKMVTPVCRQRWQRRQRVITVTEAKCIFIMYIECTPDACTGVAAYTPT